MNTGKAVAVKLVRLVSLKEDHITQIMEEIDLVKRLSHPSIIKYEGMTRDEGTLRIVLEYVPHPTVLASLPLLRLLPSQPLILRVPSLAGTPKMSRSRRNLSRLASSARR